MVHVYGHSWPVRWGKSDELRLVRVYSNCESVELFVNGQSVGRRQRRAGDFPCSGLRWQVPFRVGPNELRAIAYLRSGHTITDTVRFRYQTESWSAPAALQLRIAQRDAQRVIVEATLHDATGTLCLDARNRIRFSLAGVGTLRDNLGTVEGSRVVELANGRAWIAVDGADRESVLAVICNGVNSATLQIP